MNNFEHGTGQNGDMPSNEQRPTITPIGGESRFLELMNAIGRTPDRRVQLDSNTTGVKPNVEQDGGYEIHPDLKGITFNFWIAPEGTECGVNFSGQAEKAPWANALTGKVFRNMGEAKGWLRQEAERLSGTPAGQSFT